MRMGLGTAILLLAAPVAFFALFFAGPFLVLAVESLSDRSGAPTAQHYVSVLTDSYYWKALANTLLISLYVTAFCFIAGYPIAYYLIFHLRGAWLRRFVSSSSSRLSSRATLCAPSDGSSSSAAEDS